MSHAVTSDRRCCRPSPLLMRRLATVAALLLLVVVVVPPAAASSAALAVRRRGRRPSLAAAASGATQQPQPAAADGQLQEAAEPLPAARTTDGIAAAAEVMAAAAATTQVRYGYPSNSVSFSGIKKFTLIFPLLPLGRAPTPPEAYSKLPVSSWNFTASSPGYVVLTRHEFAPSFVLSEIMYFPGTYTPPVCSAGNTRYSAMRFWVDKQISKDIGRSVWGFPKELGLFTWGDRSVRVTVNGALVFSANFTGNITRKYDRAPIGATQYNSYTPKDWLANLAQAGVRTMQFPLKATAVAAAVTALAEENADEPTVAASTAAASSPSTAAAPEISVNAVGTNPAQLFYGPLVPNLQPLRFPGCTALLNIAAASVFIDRLAFTGFAAGNAAPAWNRAQGIGLLVDTPGEFSQPVQLAC